MLTGRGLGNHAWKWPRALARSLGSPQAHLAPRQCKEAGSWLIATHGLRGPAPRPLALFDRGSVLWKKEVQPLSQDSVCSGAWWAVAGTYRRCWGQGVKVWEEGMEEGQPVKWRGLQRPQVGAVTIGHILVGAVTRPRCRRDGRSLMGWHPGATGHRRLDPRVSGSPPPLAVLGSCDGDAPAGRHQQMFVNGCVSTPGCQCLLHGQTHWGHLPGSLCRAGGSCC